MPKSRRLSNAGIAKKHGISRTTVDRIAQEATPDTAAEYRQALASGLYMTVAEYMEATKMTEETVRRHIRKGNLKVRRIGQRVLIRRKP